MTYIKKMKIHGFKSFAKPTELPFSKDYSAVIGPNGSGKSCHYDTVITISSGKEVKIGKIVEEQLKKNQNKTLKDGVYCESQEPLEIISVNPNSMKQEIKKISQFIKREGEELYNIRTSLGKELKATGCHPVMIFRDGKLKSTLIRELKENDLIASPRIINTKEEKSFDKDKSRLLGYVIGDGYIAEDRIEFVNQDKEVLQDFKELLIKLYIDPNIKERYEKNITRVYVRNKIIVNDIRNAVKRNHLGSITSEFKTIPNEILSSDKETIRNILASLFDTDGYIRKNLSVIEFCSKNVNLTKQIQRLLLRFGIISNVKERINYAYNTENKTKRSYYYLYIYGCENLKKFYINIPLRCKHKREALEGWASKNKIPNPNSDLLPKEVNKYIKNLTNLLGIKIKNEKEKYPKLGAYYEDRCQPSREGIRDLLIFFEYKLNKIANTFSEIRLNKESLMEILPLLNISYAQASLGIGLGKQTITDSWRFHGWNGKKENLQSLNDFIRATIGDRLIEIKKIFLKLQTISNSDIYWERIVSIKKTEKAPYVYDLTVLDNHNFIGDGVFVHNSNVVDSLCFVLGRLSSKSMRADNSAKLIYNGGKNGKAAKEAYVSILFDNSNGTFPAKAKEIEIKRLVRHNGQSKYFINGELRTRQQILDLLSAAKINPNGHNIILQGDITHAAEMPSEERRHIIEDIAGISVYEDKKEKAVRELEKVDSQLKEADIVLTERGTYLKELKKDYDQAARYKEFEKNIKRNKATYLHIQVKQREEKLNKVVSLISKNQSQIDSINNKARQMQLELGNKKQELQKLKDEIERSGESAQLALHSEVESLKEQLSEDKIRFTTLQNEIKFLNERTSQLKSSLQDSDKRVQSSQEKKSKLEDELGKLKDEHSKKLQELGKLKEKHSMEDLEKEIAKIDAEIESIKSQNLDEKKLGLLREKDKIEIRLGTIEKLASKQQLARLNGLRQDLKRATNELNELSEDDTTLLNQLSSARIKLQQIKEEHIRLKTQQTLAKEHSTNLAVSKIKSLNMQGVFGTFAELAQVPPEYSMAIEVAAGSRINSIVVRDDDVASKCIKYLKSNKLGTAIFLPLNKLKTQTAQKISHGHGPAIDILKFDSKFKQAFQYVLGNTIIVDNIDAARKIGIGKYRMATLDGDLVETSGAMIGGFRRKHSSLFLIPGIEKNLDTLSSEISKFTSLTSDVEKRLSVNGEKIRKAREEKSTLEGEMLRIQASVGDVEDILKEKQNLDKNLKQTLNEIGVIDSAIKKNSSLLKDLGNKRVALRERIGHKRNPKVMAQIESLEKYAQSLNEKKIMINSEINNISTQIKELILPEKESMLKIIKQNSLQMDAFSSEIKQLSSAISGNESKIREKEKQEVKLYSSFKDMLGKREKSSQAIQENEIKINNEKNKTQIFEERINNFNIDKAKITSEIAGLNQELQEYKDVSLRKGLSEVELKDEMAKFESMMRNLGNVNLRALEIYEEVNKEYESLELKSGKLKEEKQDVLKMIDEVESKKTFTFMKSFNKINSNFESIFSQLTTKGTAHLILENPEKPLEGGIQIMVKIAQNKFLDIKSLSGGEKTLTALAFIFSIQDHEPAPFYLLDEVDAALDKKNSEKLSELIKKYSQKAQYIVITHNDSVISQADKLYGVSMHQDGISHVVSLKV